MNTTCDAVGSTAELRECLVETKNVAARLARVGKWLLALVPATVELSASDEQILALP